MDPGQKNKNDRFRALHIQSAWGAYFANFPAYGTQTVLFEKKKKTKRESEGGTIKGRSGEARKSKYPIWSVEKSDQRYALATLRVPM